MSNTTPQIDSVKRRRPRPVGTHYDGDLRRALIDAAALIISETGSDQVSLRDVARRAGVSHAAPAHHFGDKTGLLTAVATEGFHRFVLHMADAFAEPWTDPVEQLQHLGRAYAQFAAQHSGYFDLMFRPSLIDVTDPAYETASATAFDALTIGVAELQRAGWRPNVDTVTLASAVWSLAHGVTVLRTAGSLQRHLPDDSLDGVSRIAAALLSPGGEGVGRAATPKRRGTGRT